MKSQVPIDQLLVWAFRDGHPPGMGERQSMRGMFDARFFELGTVIDALHFGGPSYVDDRHPDAVRVQEAVFRLCKLPLRSLDLKNECTFFLGRLAVYVTEGDFRDVPAVNPGALVLQHAILGGYPRWNFGQPMLAKMIGANGQPVMLGRLIRERQYTSGSICPLRLEPRPIEIALARFEYHTWWEALTALPKSIPMLDEYIPIHPNAPFSPWMDGGLNRYNDLTSENFSTKSKNLLCTPGY